MNQGLIPARYAKALYEFATESGDDKNVFSLMQTLTASFAAEPGLQKVMANPFVAAKEKVALITTAAGPDAAGCKPFERFLGLLVENGRLDMVREIALSYIGLYRREHNIRLVTVTSAAPLDPAEEQRLRSLVQSHLGDATMEYQTAIDPELIGGFTVKIDNEKLDASVANELKQLRLSLLSK
ncbi:MAG: F0F1 ATP synthase subunit delta [Muribaculaceae bacterium]|nr:F0F1 ATP synthase subunit delta [Muribaculaceae bacterium]